ncbi:MAG TPA: sigma 54-interacting transcriptional regulator [Saprospiraceae bacterium]|nr:sigma 54-interacting transcriptional regulator [Saprospiraceae bacterium]
MIKQVIKTNVDALMATLSATSPDYYCVVDQNGGIVYLSKLFLAEMKTQPPSVFYINPEFSMMTWKKLWNEVQALGHKKIDCQIQIEGNTLDCNKVFLFKLDLNLCLYVITDAAKRDAININPTKIDDAEENTQSKIYSYDINTNNAVAYLNESGKIIFMNDGMKKHLHDQLMNIKVDDLFLETDLGPVMASFIKLGEDPKEAVLQMIMKSPKEGFIKGYLRLTFHDTRYAPARYRIEFYGENTIALYGEPVQNALLKYEKLTEDVESQKEQLVEEAIENFKFEDIITQSKAYKDILAQVAQVADTTSTVLILGETGTGKELLCNSIYKLSDRSDKILVKVNCGSIPAELIESMLFGHEKGAFTGADKQKIGKFELADQGTIFLDEIGELPLALQASLLRVLQEGEIERIGNAKTIKVDVRVIAATNRDLQKMVTEGTFRSDLYYRLNVFPIYNIPLRERKEDIPLLIKHFLNKTNKKTGRNVINISKKDFGFLTRYHYPGNIRELENIIERGGILSKDDTIDLQFLHKAGKVVSEEEDTFVSLDEMQKRYIMKVLKATNGKVSGEGSASEILEINNKTLFSRMRKLGIDPKQY